MKKLLYLSLFLFSFILLGISRVYALELDITSLGFSTCLDPEDNITSQCDLSANGTLSYSNSASYKVSNYFLVSDEFTLYKDGSDFTSHFCFYDNNYILLSCQNVVITSSGTTLSRVPNSFYARLNLRLPLTNIYLVSDDLNSISSLNYAINSLNETVGNVFSQFTWVFLLAFSIVVIGFIIALILRVGK